MSADTRPDEPYPTDAEMLRMAIDRANGWMLRAQRAEAILAELGIDPRTPDEIRECEIIESIVQENREREAVGP